MVQAFLFYLGAILYRNAAINVKTILGIHRAINGGSTPPWTNIWLNLRKRIYVKARAIPIPIFHPIPPRLFLEDRATPIIVRMNAENGKANLVFFSIKAYFTFASPRIL